MQSYEDFNLPEHYNDKPNKAGKLITKPFKLVDDGTGKTFKLYKDEKIIDIGVGRNNAKLEIPSETGQRVVSLRAKRGAKHSSVTRARVGESVARTGSKKRQIRDLSIMVRELLADPEIVKHMTHKLPEWANYMDEPNAAALIIGSAIMKAMDVKAPGQIQAAEFLRKVGWGDKFDVNVSGEVGFFAKPEINFEVVEPKENLIEEISEGEVSDESNEA